MFFTSKLINFIKNIRKIHGKLVLEMVEYGKVPQNDSPVGHK